MAIEEEDEGGGVPEWVVTFGDMMSLLLTFFIMLVSMSEIKQEDKYQAMVESLRKQFGPEATVFSSIPGDVSANSPLQFLASLGRARRMYTTRGGNEVQAVKGDHLQVQTVRPGKDAIVGGVILFPEDSVELTETSREALDVIIEQIAGKPQKVEIRGHTSRKPTDTRGGVRDHWDLAYQRCYNTMKYLSDHGIEQERIRLCSAAAYEPLNNSIDPELRQRNARVEVLLWDERVDGSTSTN